MSDEVTNINFHISKGAQDNFDWNDIEVVEMIQDGEEVRLYKARPFLARFIVDENLQPIPHAQAKKMLLKLSREQMQETFNKFAEAIKESAVPKASASLSSSRSEVNSAETSPDGAVL